MWWNRRRRAQDTEEALRELQGEVETLKKRQATLRSEFRDLALEWESTWEKLRTLPARLGKRQQRETEQEPNGRPDAINPAAAALLGLNRRGE